MPRATAQLLAPMGDPEKVICVGLNYHDHCQEQGAKVPKEPLIFSKFPSAITGPFDDIVHPQDTSVGTPGPTPTPPGGMALPAPILSHRSWTGRWSWLLSSGRGGGTSRYPLPLPPPHFRGPWGCPPVSGSPLSPGGGGAGARAGVHGGQRRERPGLADAAQRAAVAAGENLRHLLSPGAGHRHQGGGGRWDRDGMGPE